MGIMDMFNNAFKPAAPATPPATPAPTPGTPGNLPAGDLPKDPPNPAGPNGESSASPFADFKGLWETDPNATPTNENLFNVDPQKLQEAASKVDFSKVVTPESLQAIQAGGEGATKAMLEAMNKMSQQVYAQSAFAATQMVEQAVSKARKQFEGEIPSIIKKQQVNANLRTENALFNDPAVAPLIQALETQFTAKFPNSTATEITDMAKRYLEGVSGMLKSKDTTPAENNSDGEPDWAKLFGVDTNP